MALGGLWSWEPTPEAAMTGDSQEWEQAPALLEYPCIETVTTEEQTWTRPPELPRVCCGLGRMFYAVLEEHPPGLVDQTVP